MIMHTLPVRQYPAHLTETARRLRADNPDATTYRTCRFMIGNNLPFPVEGETMIIPPNVWTGGKVISEVDRMTDSTPSKIAELDTVDLCSLTRYESPSRVLADRGVRRFVYTWTEREGRERWSVVIWIIEEGRN
jgi:hypothetical protein